MPNSSSPLRRAIVQRLEHPPVLSFLAQADHEALRTIPIGATRIRKIAVALDGSPLGERAIPYALGLAKMAKAELQLMYVRASPISRGWRGYLPAIAERLEGSDVHLRDPIYFGGVNAVRRLCSEVDESMDLVVTSSQRSTFGRMLSSCVSDRLLQTTSTPLLIVRGSIPPSDFHWSPPLRRVLVPLLGHKVQHELLETVAQIGRLTAGSQTLLRIIPLKIAARASGKQEGPRHPATALSTLREAESDLNHAASYLPNPHTKLVYSTSPLETTVLSNAFADEFDLIALSTRTRSRLGRFVRPDVYDLLLRRTCLPLLVFREEPMPT